MNKFKNSIIRIFFVILIYFEENFWRLRINLFILIFRKNSRIGRTLYDLKKNGIAVVPKFFDDEKISTIKKECVLQLDNLPFDKLKTGTYVPNLVLGNKLRVEKDDGTIKIKGLHILDNFFKKIGRDLYSNVITLIYKLSLSRPFLIYSLTHDGSFKHPSVPEPCTDTMIAGIPHIDSPFHGLRGYFALEDVKLENGPMIGLKKSMNQKEVKKYYLNYLLQQYNIDQSLYQAHHVSKKNIKGL